MTVFISGTFMWVSTATGPCRLILLISVIRVTSCPLDFDEYSYLFYGDFSSFIAAFSYGLRAANDDKHESYQGDYHR